MVQCRKQFWTNHRVIWLKKIICTKKTNSGMAYDGNIYKKDSKFRTTFGKHDTDSSPQKQFLSTFVKYNTGSSGFRGGGGFFVGRFLPLRDWKPLPTQRAPPLYYFEISIFG